MRLSPIAPIPAVSTYRPTASLYAELDRVAHRVRPTNASFSDEFLSTPEMTNFDDETREIRAKMNLLMRKIYAPPPRVQKPCYFPIKTEEPYPKPDYAYSTILTPMRRVHRDIGRRAIVLHQQEIEKHPRPSNIGKGRLACVSFAGGRAFPRRRNLAEEADAVKSEVSCLSYYGRMRNAVNEESENRKPSPVDSGRNVPAYTAPLRSKNKTSGDGLSNKGRKLTDPIPLLTETNPKRQQTRDSEDVKVKRQVSRDMEEPKFKRQQSRDQEEVKVKRQSSQDYDDVKVKRQASRDLSENIFTRQISKEQVQPPEPEPEQVMEVDSTVPTHIPEPEEVPVFEPEPEEESKAARKKRREEKRKLKEQQQSQEEVPLEAAAPVNEAPVEVPPQAVEEPPKEELPVETAPAESTVAEPVEQQPAEPVSEPAPAEPEPQPEVQPEPQPTLEADVNLEAPVSAPEEVPIPEVSPAEPTSLPEETLQTSESVETAPEALPAEPEVLPAEPEVLPAEPEVLPTEPEVLPENPEPITSPEPLVEEPLSPEIEIPLEGQNIEDVVLSVQQSNEPLVPVDDFWGSGN